MDIGWYINRLRRMGPAEIAHRLLERARQSASRRRHEGWSRYASAAPLRDVFPHWRERVRAAGPEQRRAIVAAARRSLAGRFEALGRSWPERSPNELFPAGFWSLDPVTGGHWPANAYCFDIDFRAGGGRGDVKYVWEVNRLQTLPVLAAFALLEDDTAAVRAIDIAIASWHEANPPFRGVGWASGIEVALRAISLLTTLSLIGDRLAVDTHRRVAETIRASAFWLPRFPSLHSSANNHRVAELAGEFVVALASGGDPRPAQRGLGVEIERQILVDGAPAEQTPTYGAFTAELALVAEDAARQAGLSLPPVVGERLAAFVDFVFAIGPTWFGDNDEGRVLSLGNDDDYPQSVAAAIAGARSRAIGAPDFLALLMGRQVAPVEPSVGLRTFAAGGLSIWRGELAGRAAELAFDHGPLGYLSIAAHGHADALALSLALDGRPVLVDPGTYLYGSGGVWRSWFRSTPAHNTLNLDGVSQSRMAGPFNWSQKAVARLTDSTSGADWSLTAKHDGYQRDFGVVHERRVEKAGDSILVTDRLLGRAQRAEIVWQLAPGLVAERIGEEIVVSEDGQPLLALGLPAGEIAISAGAEDAPGSGWVSPRFGIKLPAMRVAWHGEVNEVGVTTRLRVIAAARR